MLFTSGTLKWAAVIMLWFYSYFALAKQQSPHLLELSLKELLSIQVSSTTLTPIELKDAPASISILTASQLNNMPYKYLHEVMNLIPGYQAFRQGESGDEYYHSVRGRRVGTSSREVLILVNGVRFNRESDNASAVPSLLLESIEKVEFIRGPGSAIYGSNAFTGVVSITTKSGVKQVSTVISDQGLMGIHGSYGLVLKDWFVDVHAHIEQEQGHELSIENPFSHEYELSSDGSNKSDFRFNVHRGEFQFELAQYQREALDFYVLEQVGARNKTQNTFRYASVKNRFSLSPRWDLSFNIYQTDALYKPKFTLLPSGFANDFGGSSPDSQDSYNVNVKQHETVRALSLLNNVLISKKHSFQVGGELRKAELDSVDLHSNFDLSTLPIEYTGGELSSRSVIADDRDLSIKGLFVQYQGALTETVNVVAGLRGDNYSLQKSVYSPRLALSWGPTGPHTIKLLYGEAFRSPTINEKYVKSNASFLGNANLSPETIETLELIWLWDSSYKNLIVSLFSSEVKGGIYQAFDGDVRTFDNSTQKDRFQGIEVEGSWALSDEWRAAIAASHISKAPSASFRQASSMASFSLNYTLDRWHWHGSLQYAGKRSMQSGDQQRELAGYLLLATSVSYQMQAKQTLSLKITNAGNKQYLTPTQGNVLYNGLPNRGAEVYLRYSKDFD